MAITNVPRKGPGRKKGIPNKVNGEARLVLAQMVESMAPKVAGWIEEVAADDPGKAAGLFLAACEYFIPKLGRTEVTGPDGGPQQVVIEIHKITDP